MCIYSYTHLTCMYTRKTHMAEVIEFMILSLIASTETTLGQSD